MTRARILSKIRSAIFRLKNELFPNPADLDATAKRQIAKIFGATNVDDVFLLSSHYKFTHKLSD